MHVITEQQITDTRFDHFIYHYFIYGTDIREDLLYYYRTYSYVSDGTIVKIYENNSFAPKTGKIENLI